MAKAPDKKQLTENDISVLFGQPLQILPKELDDMGLSGKVEMREIPGVVPTWKPVNIGDFLLGRCVDYRKDIGKFGSDALIFETAVPGGFRTVWLSGDLQIKMRDAVGKCYQIQYDGTMDTKKGNPMKVYRVMEVIPALTSREPGDED